MRLFSGFTVCAFACLFSLSTYGQQTIYKSSVDDALSIKTITVAPMADNVSQVYAKPLTSQLRSIVESDRQWDLRSFPDAIKDSPENFEDKPEAVKAALKKASADAMISTRLTKGPNGISIKMNLFLAADGLLLAQENLTDYSGFEIADLRSQLEMLYGRLKSKLPYSGVVLSRKNRQVTVNLGTQHGIKEGYELSVVQVIKVNRHPRFKFVVSSEKEIIGRIIIDKAEESLSFGTVVLERSENVLQPGMKIVPVNFVAYPATLRTADGKVIPDLSNRGDSQAMLGSQPREWVPMSPPSIGKISLMVGLGSYAVNNTLNNVRGVGSEQMPTPSIHVNGEIWLTSNWFMDLGLSQYVLTLDNAYPNSTPGEIAVSSTKTSLNLGYNFLMQGDFFGPKFQWLLGYSKFSSTVDTSAPTAYTSMSFGGLALGLAGSLPVSEEFPLTMGAKLTYLLTTEVDETPVTSGSSSSGNVSTFSVFGTYRWTEHMNFRGELMYDLYSAKFSGTGTRGAGSASSASHTLTTFAGGLEYLF